TPAHGDLIAFASSAVARRPELQMASGFAADGASQNVTAPRAPNIRTCREARVEGVMEGVRHRQWQAGLCRAVDRIRPWGGPRTRQRRRSWQSPETVETSDVVILSVFGSWMGVSGGEAASMLFVPA